MLVEKVLLWILVGGLLALSCLLTVGASEEEALFGFDKDFDVGKVEVRDAKVSLTTTEAGAALRIASGHAVEWPGLTLKAPKGRWDLSTYEYVVLDVKNVGDNEVTVCCRVDNPGADGVRNCLTGSIKLTAGAGGALKVPLTQYPKGQKPVKLFGMRGYPMEAEQPGRIDATNVVQILVFVPKPKADHLFEIDNVRAGGTYTPPKTEEPPKPFFPFIDTFGQYVHKDWPGKTHSVEDLAKRREAETADLAKRPGPEGWDQYGGWKAGPQLETTGHFRVEKYRGKWWLVDPEGRLFWSHGIDCVTDWGGVTPITDRKDWFRDLPDAKSPLAQFYGKGNWAPHGYYQGKSYETFGFTAANLFRKYGPDWKRQFAEVSHHRLRSWGMNTVGNWSSEGIYLLRRTPYVATIHFGGKLLEGSEGYWGKFRDVFDPSFKRELQDRLAKEKGKSADDPWCLGYFVDNELSWGDEVSLAAAALTSPPEQAAKQVLVQDLKAKYETVEKLNQAWATQYTSWEALLQSRTAPDRSKAYEDLASFYTKTAEQYFRACREAVKEVAPNNLYLGCRFAWVNDRAALAAAKYCDVISYNLYWREVAGFRLPANLDKPVIIGEFHFGALDRGMLHTGLQKVENQAERAKAYETYVLGALRNPFIVGTHWFQYGDQATTGRGDGENYQIGFLDVVDTPYIETVEACREVGYDMYRSRLEGK